MTPSPEETMERLAAQTRRDLLRRIDARLGQTLAGRVEAEDILQQAFISAIPHYRRRPVHDARGFVRWMLQFATNEIRNASRRRRGQSSSLEPEMPSTPYGQLGARQRKRRRGSGAFQHERVLAMRDRFILPWTTVAFLLDRPNASSTRKLLGRARRGLRASLSDFQVMAEDAPA